VREERRKAEISEQLVVARGWNCISEAWPLPPLRESDLVTANLRLPASPCRGFDGCFAVAVGPFGVM